MPLDAAPGEPPFAPLVSAPAGLLASAASDTSAACVLASFLARFSLAESPRFLRRKGSLGVGVAAVAKVEEGVSAGVARACERERARRCEVVEDERRA